MGSLLRWFAFCCMVPAAFGQTETASIAGTVLDARTQKPVPAAFVLAIRCGAPPFSKTTKSGGDGAFQIQGLAAGAWSLCVQAPGNGYLDPCQWSGNPTTVTLGSGQAATGISLRITAGSVLNIQVKDAQRILSQKTRDGRRPHLMVGVWGPNGLYHPAHAARVRTFRMRQERFIRAPSSLCVWRTRTGKSCFPIRGDSPRG